MPGCVSTSPLPSGFTGGSALMTRSFDSTHQVCRTRHTRCASAKQGLVKAATGRANRNAKAHVVMAMHTSLTGPLAVQLSAKLVKPHKTVFGHRT